MSATNPAAGPWPGARRRRPRGERENRENTESPFGPAEWLLHAARRHHGRGGGPGEGFPFGGPGFGGPGFGGFPGGRFGRGPRVRRGDVRAAALALLAEQPRNGYQIIQEIADRSGGVWRPSSGSVYPALQQLEDEGLIEATTAEGRRAFTLTESGRRYVEEHAAELAAPWDAVSDTVADGMVELRGLIGQVAGAVMQVASAGTPAQLEHAREVLVETRRTLYRILADDAGGDTAAQSDDAPVDEGTAGGGKGPSGAGGS